MENKGKNMETKIDLDKLNEQDWGKYRKMRKIAQREKISWASVGYSVLIFAVFGIIIGFLIFQPAISLHQIGNLANDAFNQFNASVHSSNITSITSLNSNPTIILSNVTINKTITVLASNPKALSAFTVAAFLSANIIAIVLTVVVGMILLIYFIVMFFSADSIGLPHMYRQLQRRRDRIEERNTNLRAYGFSPQEIAWYHAVRSELIKLELEYQM
jgi:hypothetical protein